MSGLNIFALIVLIVLVVAAVAIWIALGIWPGKIAEERGHKQADSVRVCGYWGALTLGILMPLAFIWAYWDFGEADIAPNDAAPPKDEVAT